ncbi:snRNA-activating protein complex subunit 3 isoform X2 [Orussus abietinus]|uniref:snRNA-activating protein complex subunit 3 isoform X2 n=1 Tax=Orussus abietinus TaxID=222816 RepID=UPI000626E4C3|nr:snRNA-activating protein complex subunit 3 isoform X2 [Orussus abietinus]
MIKGYRQGTICVTKMDSIYGAYNKNSSDKINLKTYFDEYANEIEPKDSLKAEESDDALLLSCMGVNLKEEQFSILAQYCSVDHLTVPDEIPRCSDSRNMRRKEVYDFKTVPEGTQLQTLLNLKRRLRGKQKVVRNSRFRNEILVRYDDVKRIGQLAIPGQDIIVYIRIYNPFFHRNHYTNFDQLSRKSLNCVIAILGSQTLTQLRDKITCSSDGIICTDVSAGPKGCSMLLAKGTFFNDFRAPGNKDYSQVIREWGETRNLGPFDTASMESTRIDSISTRFGYPWVYQHQGSCEHLIVFSDARLISSKDDLAISCYPRIHKIKQRLTRYCMMCGVFAVQWFTTEHSRLPHNPCFFCDTCFKSYNYINGEKVGTFKAYPYPGNAAVEQ